MMEQQEKNRELNAKDVFKDVFEHLDEIMQYIGKADKLPITEEQIEYLIESFFKESDKFSPEGEERITQIRWNNIELLGGWKSCCCLDGKGVRKLSADNEGQEMLVFYFILLSKANQATLKAVLEKKSWAHKGYTTAVEEKFKSITRQ